MYLTRYYPMILSWGNPHIPVWSVKSILNPTDWLATTAQLRKSSLSNNGCSNPFLKKMCMLMTTNEHVFF